MLPNILVTKTYYSTNLVVYRCFEAGEKEKEIKQRVGERELIKRNGGIM